jgi:hypothetical protein
VLKATAYLTPAKWQFNKDDKYSALHNTKA